MATLSQLYQELADALAALGKTIEDIPKVRVYGDSVSEGGRLYFDIELDGVNGVSHHLRGGTTF